MGWTFTRGATKQDVVRGRLKVWDWVTDSSCTWLPYPTGSRIQSTVLKYKVVGNSLWTVRETTVTAPDGLLIRDHERFIALDLLESSGDGWGYKDMDEAMGPYDTSCPVEFLDLVPMPEGEYASGWREKVRARAAAEAKPVGLFA